jgi:hypothetical protein
MILFCVDFNIISGPVIVVCYAISSKHSQVLIRS